MGSVNIAVPDAPEATLRPDETRACPDGEPGSVDLVENRPLRILYHHRIAASDGMRVHIMEMVEALRARGHEVRIVGPGAGGRIELSAGASSHFERAVEQLRRAIPAAAYELLELLYNIPAYLRLSAAVRAFKPDVLYERYNLFLLAGLALRTRRTLPMLLEVNSPLAAERAALGQLRLKGLGRACEEALWRGADAVLPVSGVLATEVTKARGADAKVEVIHNGANLGRRPGSLAAANVRRCLDIPPEALILGFVGFARAWHGVGWALEALRELPDHTHLVIVGDGPALESFRGRADELGLRARVHLTGRVPHQEVAPYMQAFDIALQTAAVPYASPLKLFEYMGLGRAIIAPDQANIREVLTDSQNAVLFAPDSETAFRRCLQRLCADSVLRRRLGAAALRTVEDRPFTWASNAARIEALARGLILQATAADHIQAPAATLSETTGAGDPRLRSAASPRVK
jgi:glycosyltransferase involved in cell wall biosynthesis